MDRITPPDVDEVVAAANALAGPLPTDGILEPVRYPAAANGILTTEGLRRACGRVWRDSNSIVMLGPDVLNSEPVSYDDKQALVALQRHLAASPRRAFTEDILPNLGFGPAGD